MRSINGQEDPYDHEKRGHRTFSLPSGKVRCPFSVLVLRDDKYGAVLDTMGVLHLINRETKTVTRLETELVEDVQFSWNSRYRLYSVPFGNKSQGQLKILEIENGNKWSHSDLVVGPVRHFAISHDDEFIGLSGNPNQCRVFRFADLISGPPTDPE